MSEEIYPEQDMDTHALLYGDEFRSQRGCNALRLALREVTENRHYQLSTYNEAKRPLTWPSTLDYVETHCDGFYGVTTIAGDEGTGKTCLSTSSAIESACNGFQVVYFAAEDDEDGFQERFNNYMAAHPECEEGVVENLHFQEVGRGQTPESLTITIMHCIDVFSDKPLLIVLDSINSIVNLGNDAYFNGLRNFGLWAMFARRISKGDVSFLINAETNREGSVKGESLKYWSDMMLILRAVKESEDVVDLELKKSRRSAGKGAMGKYLRNWQTGCFESYVASFAPHTPGPHPGSNYDGTD